MSSTKISPLEKALSSAAAASFVTWPAMTSSAQHTVPLEWFQQSSPMNG